MRHEDWYIESRHFNASSGIAMGRMSLGFVNTAPQPARIENGQLLAVMDGELYDAASLRADLRSAGCPVTGESHAELLLHGYLLQGQAFFRNLHGSFTVAIRFLSILGGPKETRTQQLLRFQQLRTFEKESIVTKRVLYGKRIRPLPKLLNNFPVFQSEQAARRGLGQRKQSPVLRPKERSQHPITQAARDSETAESFVGNLIAWTTFLPLV